jgi:ADP-heptose:LPS heptosyltransferase
VLERAIAGDAPADLPEELLAEDCGQALFGVLVEGLADRFEPRLCDAYARLFSQAVEKTVAGVGAVQLVERYFRVRAVGRRKRLPHNKIFVLSRITLGADVVVTSVVMSAAKELFPNATIGFVGPYKNYELFAGDPRVQHVPVSYHRGGLRDRLAVREELKGLLDAPDSLVLDPDSRLTQLGLLPVCDEERYCFFESRGYGADSPKPLAELTANWAAETFGVAAAKPYIALPGLVPKSEPYIAISLGVGENQSKRISDPFEERLLALLAAKGMPLYIDKGAGGEEEQRVLRAVERAGVQSSFWEGSFAGFARIIAGSRLYVGYDSAGQHIASATGVPLITIFTGFPVPRMFERWKPSGDKCRVVRLDRPDADQALSAVTIALNDLTA